MANHLPEVNGALHGRVDRALAVRRGDLVHPKDRLQYQLTALGLSIAYAIASEAGPPHDRTYVAAVTLTDSQGATHRVRGGSGGSRREADASLARAILAAINGTGAGGGRTRLDLRAFVLNAGAAFLANDGRRGAAAASAGALGTDLWLPPRWPELREWLEEARKITSADDFDVILSVHRARIARDRGALPPEVVGGCVNV